jgi:DNA repair protein RadD
MYTLRPYQYQAVQATLVHFRQSRKPAVVVLPTGAGKSLIIAELARIARGRVLVLAHVKELVEQNHLKFSSLGLPSGIWSAGMNRKEADAKVVFGSIQSVARAPDDFFHDFSLLVIDECHRVSVDGETQYLQVITKLQQMNPQLAILGLTATPYRLGFGWIYEYDTTRKLRRTRSERFFKLCIYELPIRDMIRNGYLTPPIRIDQPIACYDFSSLKLEGSRYVTAQIEKILADQRRITPVIIRNIVDISQDRQGVMIFTTSVRHAREILTSLPNDQSAIVVGETQPHERERIIEAFKRRELKYLVNVSVLTTGFDAPHVDVIAILRPTESVSLYQQIVGRGLRLSEGKLDCLILDYTGQGYDLFTPEVDDDKPSQESVLVEVPCPKCGVRNDFWGIVDSEGFIEEHFGRRCQGAHLDPRTRELIECGYRFRFKRCNSCGAENDIAAKACGKCGTLLVDNDTKLKEAMALKDAHVMRVDSMSFHHTFDKQGSERLEVHYHDVDANTIREFFSFDSVEARRTFYLNFSRMHSRRPELIIDIRSATEALAQRQLFRAPAFVIARKHKRFWKVREKIFESE